jgi:hypothetical protein
MTPDVIANAIVAAISAGAVAGATDTAKAAVSDSYQGLKSLIKRKFGDHSNAVGAIEQVEAKPDSEGRRRTLAEELKAVNIGSDLELVSAGQALIALIKSLPQSEKHVQYAQGTGIAQSDRGGSAAVHFHAPPPKHD